MGRKALEPPNRKRGTSETVRTCSRSRCWTTRKRKDSFPPEHRKGKLTTAQRYLGNAFLRDALGLDSSNLDDIARDRSEQDFDVLLSKFSNDLVSGKVNSRSNKDEIKEYSRELVANKNISGKRVAPVLDAESHSRET